MNNESSQLDDMPLDAVTLEIILSGLHSIMDETYIALMKSAYSTNIKERNDHSTALIDRDGRLIAICERSQPIHLSSMLGLTNALLKKYRFQDIRPGDIFVANDPYAADGSHLPDINFSAPVFVNGEFLCFMCNIAHHADVGGMAPGSMSGGMSEIYQEGLRIPPLRLFDQGKLLDDVLDLLLLNVRVPDERRGDYFAQIASCRLGMRRMTEMSEKYGAALLRRAFSELITRTNTRARRIFSTLAPGTYAFEDVMDDDGFGAVNIPIRVQVTVGDPSSNGVIRCDFTGTSPEVKGNINVPLRATQSSVVYVLRSMLDPEVPTNQGLLDAIEIIAPHGSLLNARFPSAVAGRANTCQRIIDVMIGALSRALPTQAVAASNGSNTALILAGIDPQSKRPYVYLETVGGGFGGRAQKDGKDGVQVHLINTSNLPVEAIEMEYPLLIESYGFLPDSGGAGKYRGGLGLRRVVRPVGHSMIFTGQGERFLNPPWGLFGGESGGKGRFLIRDADQVEHPLPTKPGLTTVNPEEALIVETAGAGGYGNPTHREHNMLDEDLRSGKFTPDHIKKFYSGHT